VAITRNPAFRRDDGVMKCEDKFARWHWRATLAKERSSIASTKEYEFRLIHRYVPVEQFPFIEGHQFTLEWHDLFFPEGLGDGSRERYITEDFRRDTMVVRALPMAILRRMDCVLAPVKAELLAEAEKYAGKMDHFDVIAKKKFGVSFYNTSVWDFTKLTGDPDGLKANIVDYISRSSASQPTRSHRTKIITPPHDRRRHLITTMVDAPPLLLQPADRLHHHQ
jgi:hypothetical protein